MSASQHMRRFGQAIGYYPELTKVFGSVTASILFAQLFYWQPKASSELGVYKTAEELERETGLSVDEQRGARKRLVKLGVLVETHKRLEHKIYFRIDEAAFDALWDARFAEFEEANAASNGETDIPSPERDIPSPGVGNSQSPNGNFPFGKSEIPIRHSNTEDYSRGLQQGITAGARANPPASPPPDPPPEPPIQPVAKPARFEPLSALLALGVDAQAAADWLAVRKAKRAALTQTALDDVVAEAGKAGISVAQAVRICAARGWQGFRASWDWRDDVPQGRTFDHGQPALSAGEQARQQALRIAEKMGLTPEQVGIYDANQ